MVHATDINLIVVLAVGIRRDFKTVIGDAENLHNLADGTAFGGTGVTGEVETVEWRGKTLARGSGVSWCSRDRGEHWGIPEPTSYFSS